MDAGLAVALVLTAAFATTNGAHDASNSIATLVATRGATPRQAIALAAVCTLLGPLLVGAAVAATIGGIVAVDPEDATAVIAAALAAALTWNIVTWWAGLPASSGHALVGGLIGAGLAQGGVAGVHWGGFADWRPTGVVGTLASLALSPALGALAALGAVRVLRRGAHRATRRWNAPVRLGQWSASAALAISHGANDAQKTAGVVAALLVAAGSASTLTPPVWAQLGCAAFLTGGTCLGGWRIIRTVGRGIYPIGPLDSLASQSASAGVIFGASLIGAPTSTTQVVASSVVGVGVGRERWRHVRWASVGHMGLAWIVTMPVTAVLAAALLGLWRVAA